ncbi:MAG TPA: hypothetical protein GX696_00620, partial [Pseudomonadaceae bacterium]|nr:hypothetical protein [Pseudomonadaceae bacterium]
MAGAIETGALKTMAWKAIVLLWGLLLVACATPPAGTDWPATLPPHVQFAEVWQGDAANG